MEYSKNRKFMKLASFFLCIALVLSGNLWGNITFVRAAETEDTAVYHGDGYTITIEISSKWDNGYNANVRIENTSEDVIRDWKLVMEGAHAIDTVWNAKKVSQEDDICKIGNDGWNQNIAAGSSVSFGFQSFTKWVTMPRLCYMTGNRRETDNRNYQIVFHMTDIWEDGCVVEADIINLTDNDITDWDVAFTWENVTIMDIWNAVIDKEQDGIYTIINDAHNTTIPANETVTFGMRIGTDADEMVFPTDARLSSTSDGEPVTKEEIRRWNRTMMHMDADSVKEAVENSEPEIKVAILDSGVDAMPEVSVVERENLIPGEEEMTEMYEDATGHGTAVASVMKFHKEDKTEEDETDGYEGYTYEYNTAELEDIEEYLEYGELDEEEDDTDNSGEEDSDMEEGKEEDGKNSGDAICLGEFIEENQADFEGINPNMELYSVRVLDEMNEAPISRIIKGIQWARENDIKILNISFGTEKDNENLHMEIKKAYEEGMLILASTGNEGEIQYPAAYEEVIGVGSVDYTGKVEQCCKNDRYIELTAPGEGVLAVGAFGVETEASGTSIAAGEVSAIASILWQQDTSVSNRFIRELLRAGANKNDNTVSGYGVVDCEYSLSIYEDLKEAFTDDEDANTEDLMEEAGTPENMEELDTVENIVTANWGGKGHLGLVPENVNNIAGNYLNILKIGIRLQDSAFCNLNDKKMFPVWHGYYKTQNGDSANYMMGYLYLSSLAKNIYDNGKYEPIKLSHMKEFYKKWKLKISDKGINNEEVDEEGNLVSNKLDKNKSIEGLPDSTWENIFKCKLYDGNVKKDDVVQSDDNYDSKSVLNQSLVVYGMALHTMTDTFAHSSWGYGKYKKYWQWGVLGKTKIVNIANDSVDICPQRYEAARQAVLNAMDHIILSPVGVNGAKRTTFQINTTKVADFCSRYYYLTQIKGIKKNKVDCNDIIDIDDYIYSKSNVPVAMDMLYLKEGFGIKKLCEYVKECTGKKANSYFQRIDLENLKKKTDVFAVKKFKIDITGAKKDTRVIIKVLYKKNKKTQFIMKATGEIGGTAYIGINHNLKKGVDYKIQYQLLDRYFYEFIKPGTPYKYGDSQDDEMYMMREWDTENVSVGNEITTLSGVVVKATEEGKYEAGSVLKGAKITLQYEDESGKEVSVLTGKNGKYSIETGGGFYVLTVSLDGYIPVTQYLFLDGVDNTCQNMTIALIPKTEEGMTGKVIGTIRDSITTKGVEGLQLKLREGYNNLKGDPLYTAFTEQNGEYIFKDIPIGYYCMEIVDSNQRYINTYINVIVTKESRKTSQDGTVSKSYDGNIIRIVLTWNDSVQDLDSHIKGISEYFHIYFGNKQYINSEKVRIAVLDVDDTSYYGPETTTVYDVDTSFRYYVHNYSGGAKNTLSNSDARVQVYLDDYLVKTLYVPYGEGYRWNVFTYKDGNFIIQNKIEA